MTERISLEENDTIALSRTRAGSAVVEFKVLSVVGKGGTTICYEAFLGKKKGRLKEFYPRDYELLRRTNDKQLQLVEED